MTPDRFTAILRHFQFLAHKPDADISALAEKLRSELAVATLRVVSITTETRYVHPPASFPVGGHEIMGYVPPKPEQPR